MADISSFNPKLAALIARVQGRAPSSNGANANSLDLSLSRVAVAEKNLEEARSAARTAARQSGVSLANLFGECSFVKRETGERWADEARAEGHAAGKLAAYEETTRCLCRINGHDYDAVMAQVKISGEAVREQSKRTQARLRAAGFFAAVEAGDLERAGRIIHELYPAPSGRRNATETARAIISAGAKARSDGSGELPDPTGLAAQIIAAGRKRRNEPEVK